MAAIRKRAGSNFASAKGERLEDLAGFFIVVCACSVLASLSRLAGDMGQGAGADTSERAVWLLGRAISHMQTAFKGFLGGLRGHFSDRFTGN
ncbi:hypothetical protein [Hydrogenophaga sp.]|uniref:hypothetical protein n=1 Tax=Hydrogenophaga sp. TaxID=1904254 RepID=UPI003F706399